MPSGAVCARMGCYNTGVTRVGLAVEVVSVVLFGSEGGCPAGTCRNRSLSLCGGFAGRSGSSRVSPNTRPAALPCWGW